MAETYRRMLREMIIMLLRKDPQSPSVAIYDILDRIPFTSKQCVDTCLPTPINQAEKKKDPYAFTRITADCTEKLDTKFVDLDLKGIAKHVGRIMTKYEDPTDPELVEIQKEMYEILHCLHLYLLKKIPTRDPYEHLDRMGYNSFIVTALSHNIFTLNKQLLMEWLDTNHCDVFESIEKILDANKSQYGTDLTNSELEEIVKIGLERHQYCVVSLAAHWLRAYRETSFFSMPERVKQFFDCLNGVASPALCDAVQNFIDVILNTHNFPITGMDPTAISQMVQKCYTLHPCPSTFWGLRCLFAYKKIHGEGGGINDNILRCIRHMLRNLYLTDFNISCLYRFIIEHEKYNIARELFEDENVRDERIIAKDDYAERIWYTLSMPLP